MSAPLTIRESTQRKSHAAVILRTYPFDHRTTMRLCVLTNILPPYRIGFYNELAKLCDLHVVLDSLSTPDRQWRVDPASLQFRCTVSGNRNKAITRAGVGYEGEQRYFNFSERTLAELRRIKPDIVVAAELGSRTIQASLYAFLRGIPLVCFWEGTPHTESQVPKVKQLLRRRLAARADGFWVNGRESAEYAWALGVPLSRIHAGMTGVDTSYFLVESDRRRGTRDTERASLGLRGTVFVCSGSLSARKGIPAYLAALRAARRLAPQSTMSLLFIGDGEHRADVEDFAREHPDVPVVITGFVQIEDLPRLYVCGDCFVLPTLEDCWPLATLEPLVCGLPQIYSRYNGASADLSQWRGTGEIVDPLDTDAFARRIAKIALTGGEPLSARVRAEVASFYGPAAQASRAFASCLRVLNVGQFAPAALQ
jgi:glycosyltransferase involved in cell wall biosynthesis